MKFYCGIDLHATNSFLCVIDDKDKILLKEKLKNNLGAILYALESFSPKPSVAVEATINWYRPRGFRHRTQWDEDYWAD